MPPGPAANGTSLGASGVGRRAINTLVLDLRDVAAPSHRRAPKASGDFQLEVVQVTLGQMAAHAQGELNPLDVSLSCRDQARAATQRAQGSPSCASCQGARPRCPRCGDDTPLAATDIGRAARAPLHEDAPYGLGGNLPKMATDTCTCNHTYVQGETQCAGAASRVALRKSTRSRTFNLLSTNAS